MSMLGRWWGATFILLFACQGLEPRSAWLLTSLTAEHRLLLLRSPSELAAKYARMAEHPYDYFRGTLDLWVRDTTEPGGHGLSASVWSSPALTQILLVGDPHPENVGTFLPWHPGGSPSLETRFDAPPGELAKHLTVEFNDFDAATFGPPAHDLRRLATGLRLLVHPTLAATSREADLAVSALANGYLDALRDGPQPPRGAILSDLLRRAAESLSDSAMPAPSTELVAPTESEARFVRTLIGTWPSTCLATCPPPRIGAIWRRLGAGVASLPLYRFYVLLEGDARETARSTVVLELKEAREPPRLPSPTGSLPPPLSNNAERVVFAQRLLQSTPLADPMLGTAIMPGAERTSFRVSGRLPAQKGLSRSRITERIADGRWTVGDLMALGAELGHLLGEAHKRSPLSPESRTPARDTLRAQLAQRESQLVEETLAYSSWMSQRILDDYQRFVALLEDFGPTLESWRP